MGLFFPPKNDFKDQEGDGGFSLKLIIILNTQKNRCGGAPAPALAPALNENDNMIYFEYNEAF